MLTTERRSYQRLGIARLERLPVSADGDRYDGEPGRLVECTPTDTPARPLVRPPEGAECRTRRASETHPPSCEYTTAASPGGNDATRSTASEEPRGSMRASALAIAFIRQVIGPGSFACARSLISCSIWTDSAAARRRRASLSPGAGNRPSRAATTPPSMPTNNVRC